MEVHTDNKAATVLKTFQNAIDQYGLPSHVCGDRGGENKDVSVFMIMARGRNHGSFMWGK